MPLTRYRIETNNKLSADEVERLEKELSFHSWIPPHRIGSGSVFEIFLESDVDISTVSPLLVRCTVTDITQYRS